jgi:hypothetical protein
MEHNIINQIHRHIGFGTLNRFFELENYEITDFVINGVCYMIRNYTGFKSIDSTGKRLCNYQDELMIELYTEFVGNEKIIDCTELNSDFYKVKLLSQPINVSTTKVIFMNFNKKLLNPY